MSVTRLLIVASIGLTACKPSTATAPPLTKVTLTDDRYKGLVFLVATVRRSGADFLITNDSTQPWFDATVVLSADTDEYRLHLNEIDAGQTVTALAAEFVNARGEVFSRQRVAPRTLIISAEIGEGGPTGVYAVRL